MRRSLLPALTALLAACGVDAVNTDITRRTPYASLRTVVATNTLPLVDVVTRVNDELPGVSPAPIGPAAGAFVQVPAGDARLNVTSDGASLATVDGSMAEGSVYTAFVTGAPGNVTLALVPERFDPVAGQTLVRLLDGSGLTDLTITIDREPIPAGREKPFVWRAIDPNGKAVVAVRDAAGTLATFSNVPLATGSFTTLVLLGSPPAAPLRLFTLRDVPGGNSTTAILDADGTVKPRTHVRVLNTVPGAAPLSVSVRGGRSLSDRLVFKGLSEDAEIEVDATIVVSEGANELASKTLALDATKTYTLALIPGSAAPQIAVWEDDRSEKPTTSARLAVSVPGLPGVVDIVKLDTTPFLPATAHATASTYVEVLAGPQDGLGRIVIGPQALPLATIPQIPFAAGHATTVAVVGTFDLQARTADLEALVIDDHAGLIVTRIAPVPLPPPPP